MSLRDIIKATSEIQREMPDGYTSYEDVPQNINQLPCWVNYPSTGVIDFPQPVMKTNIMHSIMMDFYIQKAGDLSATDRFAKEHIDIIIDVIGQNCTLKGTCLNAGVSRYNYGVKEFAGVEYICIEYELKAVEYKQTVYRG